MSRDAVTKKTEVPQTALTIFFYCAYYFRHAVVLIFYCCVAIAVLWSTILFTTRACQTDVKLYDRPMRRSMVARSAVAMFCYLRTIERHHLVSLWRRISHLAGPFFSS